MNFTLLNESLFFPTQILKKEIRGLGSSRGCWANSRRAPSQPPPHSPVPWGSLLPARPPFSSVRRPFSSCTPSASPLCSSQPHLSEHLPPLPPPGHNFVRQQMLLLPISRRTGQMDGEPATGGASQQGRGDRHGGWWAHCLGSMAPILCGPPTTRPHCFKKAFCFWNPLHVDESRDRPVWGTEEPFPPHAWNTHQSTPNQSDTLSPRPSREGVARGREQVSAEQPPLGINCTRLLPYVSLL